MPIVTLQFTSEDEGAAKLALNAPGLAAAIDDIKNDVFRPARKHGYPDTEIQELLTRLDSLCKEEDKNATDLIGMLEEKAYKILNEWDANMVLE